MIEILSVENNLVAEVPYLTASNLDDAANLHAEILSLDDGWEFLGVFPNILAGIKEAVRRNGKRFQVNFIPFEMDGLLPGYYIYFTMVE